MSGYGEDARRPEPGLGERHQVVQPSASERGRLKEVYSSQPPRFPVGDQR